MLPSKPPRENRMTGDTLTWMTMVLGLVGAFGIWLLDKSSLARGADREFAGSSAVGMCRARRTGRPSEPAAMRIAGMPSR
jgi:hypothetical protein